MCDVQGKLIAWLDRELPTAEASEVERHIEQCRECQRWVATYGHVSETFDAYCDAVMVAKEPRRVSRWVPVLASSLVAASIMLLVLLRGRVEPAPVLAPTVATASAPVPAPSLSTVPGPRKPTMHRRHAAPRSHRRATEVQPMDTAIEIAIPAEAMFPPGALPEGINFIAELRIATDGSVKQVRLRQ
ncbi:MAG TPA: zf-HC2 domain-containing protein [Terriglobales bacterium]|nr:zf-HC2 domain-containing protein [Terriglobales bacterium]